MPIDHAPAEGDAMHVVHVLSTLHVGAVDENYSQDLDSRANIVRACMRDGVLGVQGEWKQEKGLLRGEERDERKRG